MKNNFDTLFLGAVIGLLIGTLISTAVLYETTSKQSDVDDDRGPVMIWNEDDEGLPMDGELVRIEQTVNDTIYIVNK
jgi:hypothetical protein